MSVSNKALANAIRFLSIDAVEKANSGHPGMPLGMADIATVLWNKFLKHNPKNPHWFNRDRFVLSNGHGSMLLYSLLHLTGYALSKEDLEQFRQLHSKTPGHPECTDTPGVETTTGPLGQGLANAIGMAITEKILAAQFNDEKSTIVDHYTYAFVGDGCLMEGISHEACSLAGTLGLNKLIVFYDDNEISIDGKVSGWFTDDTCARFKAYNWHVIDNIDGHNDVEIEQAIKLAHEEKNKPTLIICKSIIGYGSNLAGSEKVHGAPLGNEEIARLREKLNWNYPPFHIPDNIYAAWNHLEQGIHDEELWLQELEQYKQHRPKDYVEFLRRINGDLPDLWHEKTKDWILSCQAQKSPLATRKASQLCIEAYSAILPELLGGSADLTGSNNTDWSQTKAISPLNFSGNYLHYGVRELAMSAIMNGISLHGGLIPFAGTFLVFADYAKSAVRLSALMKQRVIYIYSHDSIGLGEDGPTHQPIEQISMLRMIPNMHVWRPYSLTETAVAWAKAIERHNGPSSILLSRQTIPVSDTDVVSSELIEQGGYIIKACANTPDVILLATGSEVSIALESAQIASKQGIQVRVVSMPCVERFLASDIAYQESVLPKAIVNRIAIEAGATPYWYRFVGLSGKVIGIDTFGASAPQELVYQELKLTVAETVKAILDSIF